MKKLLGLLLLVSLFVVNAFATDRITVLITITNAPVDGDTLTVNAAARTWKASPTAAQIQTAASIGASATNLYNHIAANPFTGPLVLLRSGTNAVQLVGQVGQAMAATLLTNWGTITYTTQTVVSATTVRIPITVEPTASSQTNIASQLVNGMFNLGLSTNLVVAGSTAMSNFVNTSTVQTIGGTKTFSGMALTGTLALQAAADITLATNASLYFAEGASMILQTNVKIFDANNIDKWRFNATEATNSITVFSDITNKVNALLAGANAWTGTNTFTQITNSTVIGSTLTNGTYYGTIGLLSSGIIDSPTITNLVNRGTAIQSYINDSRNVELGSGAAVTNSLVNSVALGQDAHAGGSQGVAIGQLALVKHDYGVAIGYAATTTRANETRLGTSSGHVSMPGDAAVNGNFAIGHATAGPLFPTDLEKGLYMTNGTAASADPANGFAVWSEAGEFKYRTAATSEGAGGTQRMHNRAAQVVGNGSDFTLTGAYALLNFGSQAASVDLPTAGTYLVSAVIQIQESGAGGNDLYYFRLYDATVAAAVANSERYLSPLAASKYGQAVLSNVITVGTADTIQVQGYNATSARGTAISTATSISYVRLY